MLCVLVIGVRGVGQYPEKLWLHRCNSMEKLYEKHDRYPNIEVDLVFREKSRTFDVTHDSDTTFGLSLGSYFDYMEEGEGKMWLDIKNLTEENRLVALRLMNELTARYDIDKDRLIIESRDEEALEDFTRNGYYTSYYVDYDKPRSLSEEELDDCIEDLQEIADSGKVCALSFPGYWYDEIKENLDRPIDLLTWKHRTVQPEFLLSPSGREMLADPQLKVILIKEKGRFHR